MKNALGFQKFPWEGKDDDISDTVMPPSTFDYAGLERRILETMYTIDEAVAAGFYIELDTRNRPAAKITNFELRNREKTAKFAAVYGNPAAVEEIPPYDAISLALFNQRYADLTEQQQDVARTTFRSYAWSIPAGAHGAHTDEG